MLLKQAPCKYDRETVKLLLEYNPHIDKESPVPGHTVSRCEKIAKYYRRLHMKGLGEAVPKTVGAKKHRAGWRGKCLGQGRRVSVLTSLVVGRCSTGMESTAPNTTAVHRAAPINLYNLAKRGNYGLWIGPDLKNGVQYIG